MTDLRPSSEVYAVLLHQPQWYGVPVKIVLWVLSVMLGCICLSVLVLPGVIAKLICAALSVVGAVAGLVVLRRSGAVDDVLLEVVCRFVIYPPYLGPR
jgi:uncharacterized membrane protein YphA (DoxX/SURF4 family)